MNRGIEFEHRDGEVIVWKTWVAEIGRGREEVCRLIPQDALDKGHELRLAGSEAFRATLPPGVR